MTAPQDPSLTGSRHPIPRVCGATKPGDGTHHGARRRATPLPSGPHHSTTPHTCSAKKPGDGARPVALERTGTTLPYKYPSPPTPQFPGNPRQIAATIPLLSYPTIIGRFRQIATTSLLPPPMPLSSSIEQLASLHKIPYIPAIF